jgi:hypothetical protein
MAQPSAQRMLSNTSDPYSDLSEALTEPLISSLISARLVVAFASILFDRSLRELLRAFRWPLKQASDCFSDPIADALLIISRDVSHSSRWLLWRLRFQGVSALCSNDIEPASDTVFIGNSAIASTESSIEDARHWSLRW